MYLDLNHEALVQRGGDYVINNCKFYIFYINKNSLLNSSDMHGQPFKSKSSFHGYKRQWVNKLSFYGASVLECF